MPGSFAFKTLIPLRITDLNYGNHVGNQVFLELVHEARVRYLRHFGYSELNLENVSLIMADAAIAFKSELAYGDEVEIEVAANAFSRVGFDLVYRLTAVRDGIRRLAGEAKTGMLCFDYSQKKVIGLPENVKQQFLG